jgi:hypothetical protein
MDPKLHGLHLATGAVRLLAVGSPPDEGAAITAAASGLRAIRHVSDLSELR